MKIVYIGTNGGLAETLVERMWQEGNDVYLLSDKELSQKPKKGSLHHFYRIPRKGESFGKLLCSISPDCVIFAGKYYISSAHEEESDADVTLLAQSLRAAAAFPHVKFILLSSIEVYGKTSGRADEFAERAAVSERGVRFIREERLLDIYRKQHGMDAVILRASQLYTNRPKEGESDILSRNFFNAAHPDIHMSNNVFQPLHVSDFVDAVKRVLDAGNQYVYNVCGSAEVSQKCLYQMVCQHEKLSEQDIQWEDSGCVTLADSGRIRQELGWSDFRNLEKQLQEGEITYERAPVEHRKKKKRIVPVGIRQLVENLLIFAVFFALSSLCGSHSLFSKIDWLMIYVILISISYNIYQSAFAAVLLSF